MMPLALISTKSSPSSARALASLVVFVDNLRKLAVAVVVREL